MGNGIWSRRCTPMELSMISLFLCTLHASFHALTKNKFDRASMFCGVLKPWSSRALIAFFTSNELSRRALTTSPATPLLSVLVHAFVGNAVVPVHIMTALAFSSAGRNDGGHLLMSPFICSSSRFASESVMESRLKKSDTDDASRTIPLTLYVSDKRRATNFPTFPDAPTTATVSPGCNAFEPEPAAMPRFGVAFSHGNLNSNPSTVNARKEKETSTNSKLIF
mmetsp:Transcript_58461/g.169268  ORF Transcript_58461/g.169268 Transcript_58461/m.169268 type:complete len:223 (-) Transcript_58461:83-751(-)